MRRDLIAGGIAGLGLVLVAVLGLSSVAVRTYALRAPNEFPLVTLGPGRTVCEGPVRGAETTQGLAVWGAGIGGPARLQVSLRRLGPSARTVTGIVRTGTAESEQAAQLAAAIAPNVPVKACVRVLAGKFSIAGSPSVHAGLDMSGGPKGQEFSLLLLGPSRSVLSALPQAFGRASLFKLSWVGSWTFWLLTGGIALAFILAVGAVVAATEDSSEQP